MQNDVLKNNIAPWQEKGRWYHGIIDCATNAFITADCDDVIKNEFLLFQSGISYLVEKKQTSDRVIIDYVWRDNKKSNPATQTITQKAIRYNTSGTVDLYISTSSYPDGTVDFWIFCDK